MIQDRFLVYDDIVKAGEKINLKKYEREVNFKDKVTDFDKLGIIDPLDPNETRVRMSLEALNFADCPSSIENKNKQRLKK